MKRLLWIVAALPAYLACAQGIQPSKATMRIRQADYYVKEFEQEVQRQRGGENRVYRSKKDALDRVQALKKEFPDDPDVEALFQRCRAALMKSKGDFTEVDPSWTEYLVHEAELRKQMAAEAEARWEALIEANREKLIKSEYPTPDSTKVTVDDLDGAFVVLDDVEYPAHQFYGAAGEFVWCGRPSAGYWFLNISSRDWLNPYEAVKRYRRTVDSGMMEVAKWHVLGEVVNIVGENPNPGEDAVGNIQFGWVVRPVALYVPGCVLAEGDKFAGEEKVAAIKDGWYTVKEIPADVAPERLAEIFMTAIKEKNYALYVDAIDPERRRNDMGEDLLRYHWDLHQERFHGEYVHATFKLVRKTVRKGYDDSDEQEDFFLSDEQKSTLRRIGGEKVEEAVVESIAYDKNGKQLGSPHPRTLVRRNGGRWYVEEYEQRF